MASLTPPAAPAAAAALDPLALAVDLMRVDSTSGSEGEVLALVERSLAAHAWIIKRIPVSDGRHDVLAMSTDTPVVTLSTHLDTVPPYIAPRISGGRLSGRGACDAKGIAAAMVCAADRLREADVPVALLFVVGEETTHDGARAANEAHRRGEVPTTSRVLINGEPTESTLALGTKGAVRVTIRARGKAAHSAYPHLGHSATRSLVNMLAELDSLDLPSDPLLGETTVNIGMISGGVADNVVAPAAEARLMARLVGPADDVVARLRRWVGGRGELEVGVMMPAVRLATLGGYPTSVAAYATDIPALSRWGRPYLFGPGSVHVAHTDDEFIDVAELQRAVDTYVRIARDALAG